MHILRQCIPYGKSITFAPTSFGPPGAALNSSSVELCRLCHGPRARRARARARGTALLPPARVGFSVLAARTCPAPVLGEMQAGTGNLLGQLSGAQQAAPAPQRATADLEVTAAAAPCITGGGCGVQSLAAVRRHKLSFPSGWQERWAPCSSRG